MLLSTASAPPSTTTAWSTAKTPNIRLSATSGSAHSSRRRSRPGRITVRSQRRGPAAIRAKPSAVSVPSTNSTPRAGSWSRSRSGLRPPSRSAMAASALANSRPKTVSRTAATASALSTGTIRPRPGSGRPSRLVHAHRTAGSRCQGRPGRASSTPGQRRPPCRASEARPSAPRTASRVGQPASHRAGTASRARASRLQTTVQGRIRRPATRAAQPAPRAVAAAQISRLPPVRRTAARPSAGR